MKISRYLNRTWLPYIVGIVLVIAGVALESNAQSRSLRNSAQEASLSTPTPTASAVIVPSSAPKSTPTVLSKPSTSTQLANGYVAFLDYCESTTLPNDLKSSEALYKQLVAIDDQALANNLAIDQNYLNQTGNTAQYNIMVAQDHATYSSDIQKSQSQAASSYQQNAFGCPTSGIPSFY